MTLTDISFATKVRLIFSVVLLEFLFFVFSGVSMFFLSGDSFFSIGVDPVFWFFYLVNIPQLIVGYQWLGIAMDASIIVLLLLFIRKPGNTILAVCLFILMLCFYVTLTGYLTHRNYQSGFVLAFIPFLFKKSSNKYIAYEAVRYFLLFFYFSSAAFKIIAGALQDRNILSSFLTGQFTPYYLEGNTGWRTDLNFYLIQHENLSFSLFVLGLLVELSTIAGFFTKRSDTFIAILLILFHFGNWVIMDIGAIGQLGFISLLFLSRHIVHNRS